MKDKTPKVVLSLRIDEEDIEQLKSIARQKSAKENKDISYADLIREMIQNKIRKTK